MQIIFNIRFGKNKAYKSLSVDACINSKHCVFIAAQKKQYKHGNFPAT